MRTERPEQFGASARAARPHGYGESAEALVAYLQVMGVALK